MEASLKDEGKNRQSQISIHPQMEENEEKSLPASLFYRQKRNDTRRKLGASGMRKEQWEQPVSG